jgi:WD40 repeat protein
MKRLKLWGLNNSQVIRNLDHPERITVYTFTFDSQFVITGGDDNSCKIWELATGKLVQVLIEHDAPITSISVSSNNSLIVSGSKDKLAIIWDFKDGSVIHKLLIHQDIIVKVAVSDDGNVVITGILLEKF